MTAPTIPTPATPLFAVRGTVVRAPVEREGFALVIAGVLAVGPLVLQRLVRAANFAPGAAVNVAVWRDREAPRETFDSPLRIAGACVRACAETTGFALVMDSPTDHLGNTGQAVFAGLTTLPAVQPGVRLAVIVTAA